MASFVNWTRLPDDFVNEDNNIKVADILVDDKTMSVYYSNGHYKVIDLPVLEVDTEVVELDNIIETPNIKEALDKLNEIIESNPVIGVKVE